MSPNCPRCPGQSFNARHRFVPEPIHPNGLGDIGAASTKIPPKIFEMRQFCAFITLPNQDRVGRLPFMDALSLLFCKSATGRHDELNSWLYVALVAMTLVIFDKGAELVVLELAFFVALYLRQCAAVAARAIRKSSNHASAITLLEHAEGRAKQRRIAGSRYVTTVATRRRTLESRQASFSSLGLPHPSLTARLLPQPVSIARQ